MGLEYFRIWCNLAYYTWLQGLKLDMHSQSKVARELPFLLKEHPKLASWWFKFWELTTGCGPLSITRRNIFKLLPMLYQNIQGLEMQKSVKWALNLVLLCYILVVRNFKVQTWYHPIFSGQFHFFLIKDRRNIFVESESEYWYSWNDACFVNVKVLSI